MKSFSKQSGAILLGMLIMVTLLGLMAGIAGSSWKTIIQRAREEELLWRGSQYRKAIESYYKTAHGGTKAALPSTLESLLKDPRSVSTIRHIRKLYPDPMTGQDWVVVQGPGGGIMGVRSNSPLKPFKTSDFADENKSFEGKQSYREWLFVVDVGSTSKQTQKTTSTSTSESN